MRLTTWNVNGIRNPFSYPPWNAARSFSAMFDVLGSDIIVMQELKIQRKDLRDDMVLIDGWDCYFSLPKHKKGYSGVGIYTRNATCSPIRAEEGLLGVLPSANGTPYRELEDGESIGGYLSPTQTYDIEELLGEDPACLDAEGRCVVVEFPAFVLFGVYSPANSNGTRDGFRHGFICALDTRIRNLVRLGKNVVLVGDLNVTRNEIDSGPTLEDIKKGLINHEEFISGNIRRIFNQLLLGGEVIGERDDGREEGVLWDTTRGFHPDRRGMYTHWETKVNARPGNFGGRIDYVLVSKSMQKWVKDANIQEGLLGSDHCPVFADFNEVVDTNDGDVALLDIMNLPGVFEEGERKTDWKVAMAPPLSARRMPEFDKRRSIMSMFTAPALEKAHSSQMESNLLDKAEVEPRPLQADASTEASKPQSNETPTAAKRKTASSATTNEQKRQKSDVKGVSAKGQQSLKGFFAAKSAPAQSTPDNAGHKTITDSKFATIDNVDSGLDSLQAHNIDKSQSPATPSTAAASRISPDESFELSPTKIASLFESASASQQKWGALFSRPVAPVCEGHNEPCKSMQTKKKGSNQGRSFWMCARPLGPSGEKEKNTEWRCGTFIWCSDWQGSKGVGTGAAAGQGKGMGASPSPSKNNGGGVV